MRDKKNFQQPGRLENNPAKIWFVSLVLIITIVNLIIFSEQENVYRIHKDIIQSYQTIRATNQAMISIGDASAKISDFFLNNNENGLKNLQETIIAARVNLSTLDQLIQDDKAQVTYFNELMGLFTQKITLLEKIIFDFSHGNKRNALLEANDKSRFELTNKINSFLIHIKSIEINELNGSQQAFEKLRLRYTYLTLVENILCICLLILCFSTIKRNKTRIE
jgi:CHASE3 domain sensor protein